ncbi:hypothetical protein L249_3642 [Ophiocordyceps polyrhachis-furcata BCC 54312]|uniref:SUN domain-containing protein n=1 Tax=Ophiocordyceps polyrhachis-furcata BCC 54312 TaxID=1330021 RepID=A0A367L4Q1_9HYPO|nr:hypothetical protein L249_3642 [Ophiocordyceps polyrhachis-furcata BCC 54312]
MLINYTLSATLVVGVTALGHNHHRHRHHARAVDVPEPEVKSTVTVFINSTTGEEVSDEKAKECLRLNECVKVGEHTEITTMSGTVSRQSSEPQLPYQFEASPLEDSLPEPLSSSPPPSTSSPSNSALPPPPVQAAMNSGVSDDISDDTSDDTSNDIPKDVSKDQPTKHRLEDVPAKHTSKDASDDTSNAISHTAPPAVHKNGRPLLGLKCSEFPSPEHGTVPLTWLEKTGPWSSLQNVTLNWNANMKKIDLVGSCSSCLPGCMCGYACQPGWGETQWPPTYGSKGESIGGLFCNKDGMLEMTNPRYDTLCSKGAGNVKIQNRMSLVVSTCRTAYPGDEAMVIPAIAEPQGGMASSGARHDGTPVWTPLNTYYISPQGGRTSSHWYVNNPGIGREKACVWESDETSPIVIGAGVDADTHITFLSIAPNKKTQQKLNFNVFITGNVIGKKCMYIGGEFYESNGDGQLSPCPDGCTAAIAKGGSGTFVYTLEKKLSEGLRP